MTRSGSRVSRSSLASSSRLLPLLPLLLAACDGAGDDALEDAGDPASDSASTPVDTAIGDGVAIDVLPDGSLDASGSHDATREGATDALDAGSPTARLGAEVDATGVTFRVWAPHAAAASVTGDFAEATVAMTLESTASGIFAAHVASAHVGSLYRYSFEIPTAATTMPGSTTHIERIDPWCRAHLGDSCAVVDPSAYLWKMSTFSRPARNASLVYELHLGSFAVDAGAANGTFDSARLRLPALADLGIDVVELMPIHDYASDATHWGYNAQLYHAPHPSLGSPDALRAFVDEAHRLGIAVWIDVVVNHTTGSKTAPLYCFDGDCADGTAGLYFFPKGAYQTTPWGPRPDYTKAPVVDMLLGAAEQWLVEYRGDGFRWDSVSNIRAIDGVGTTPGGKELLVAINDRSHALGALSIAEDLKGWDGVTKSTASGGLGFDAQWDGFGYQVAPVLTQTSDDARDLGAIESALTASYGGDPFARLIFLEDHDTVGNGGARLPTKIDPVDPTSWSARRRTMLGSVLLFTAPGVPMLFMGEESLATSGFDNATTPLPAATAVGAKIAVFHHDLARLRRNLDGLSGGLLDDGVEVFHRNDAAKVIAYRRHGASGQDVIVIVNLKNKAYTTYDIGVPDAGPWRVRLNTDHTAYGDDFTEGQFGSLTAHAGSKDGKPFVLSLQLGAYGAMVLGK